MPGVVKETTVKVCELPRCKLVHACRFGAATRTPNRNSRSGKQTLNIEHFIKFADVQFTVYSEGHSTVWSSRPATIYLISIRLMLYFLFLIILYLSTTVIYWEPG
jgi:hypothetical protein